MCILLTHMVFTNLFYNEMQQKETVVPLISSANSTKQLTQFHGAPYTHLAVHTSLNED
jgi:hypothetical protein